MPSCQSRRWLGQAGKLRLVAVASDERAPLVSDVATAKEPGFPALSFLGGHCLFAPKEMPEALRARIATDVRQTKANPDRLDALGCTRAGSAAERGSGCGSPCQSAAMADGRCRMHGCPLPGAPKGNHNAFKHGRYTAKAVEDRKKIATLLRVMRELAREV